MFVVFGEEVDGVKIYAGHVVVLFLKLYVYLMEDDVS
ncbi:hypothetical protein DSUL_150018 [Desulfovibrionales bacterium]